VEIRPRFLREGGASVLKPKALFLGLMAVLVAGFALGGQAIPNWSAPARWTPPKGTGVHTMSDITQAALFIGVTPCRVGDTRGNGFTGAYGPPSLAANATRTFVIGGQCGIPAFASAVSFNFGALNVGGGGDLRVFPDGGGVPTVSTLNYNGNTPNIANAAVVPLGTTNGITVQADAVSIDLIIDVNGYYTGGNANPTLPANEDFGLIGDSAPTWCAVMYSQNSVNDSNGCMSAMYGELFGTAAGSSAGRFINHSLTTGGQTTGVHAQNVSTAGNSSGLHAISGSTTIGGPLNNIFHAGAKIETANDGNGILVSANNGGSCINFGIYGGIFNTAGGLVSGAAIGNCGSVGVSYVGGLGGSGPKSFFEPHPTDASKMIRYVSLEGPEAGTYFRGTAKTVGGYAVIEVPETFRIVTDDEGLTTQLTTVGSPTSIYVFSEDLNRIVVRSSKDVTFHYLVQGVRRAYKNVSDVTDNTFFRPVSPTAKMPEYSPLERQRLIDNGTYNEDGSVNLKTAERVGWAASWRAVAEEAAMKELEGQPPNTTAPNKPN
jgi:hypothetical protein